MLNALQQILQRIMALPIGYTGYPPQVISILQQQQIGQLIQLVVSHPVGRVMI